MFVPNDIGYYYCYYRSYGLCVCVCVLCCWQIVETHNEMRAKIVPHPIWQEPSENFVTAQTAAALYSLYYYRERDDALAIVFRNQGRAHSVSNTTPFVVTLETREYGGCRCSVCVWMLECDQTIMRFVLHRFAEGVQKRWVFVIVYDSIVYEIPGTRVRLYIHKIVCGRVDVGYAPIVFVFTYYIFDEYCK